VKQKINKSLDVLQTALRAGESAAFSSSMGMEDQVLAHMIVNNRLSISIFTLDTGRLPSETYSLITATEEFLKTRIHVYFPDHQEVEQYVCINGIDGFYQSRPQRLACCQVRKVNVLKRALSGKSAWITGIRREQSPDRQDIVELEFDTTYQLIKANPLVQWTMNDIRAYVDRYAIPVNPLHNKGYLSLGCAPCTRPIKAGEPLRAGRWWWEADTSKECGLHTK
jgi:phosphoadenosine phosphosulfate reductase